MSPTFPSFSVFMIKASSLRREAAAAGAEELVFIFGSIRRIKPIRNAEPQFVPFNNCLGLDHMMLTEFTM